MIKNDLSLYIGNRNYRLIGQTKTRCQLESGKATVINELDQIRSLCEKMMTKSFEQRVLGELNHRYI